MSLRDQTSCADCDTTLLPLREDDDAEAPSTWRRLEGRERVRVERVWTDFPPVAPCVAVRCHPLHGGKAWFAPLCEFLKRFDMEATNA